MAENRLKVLASGALNGRRVKNLEGERIGRIEEIVIELTGGRIAYAVLSFGGFLGFGDKFFAIPWNALKLTQDEREFLLDLPREKLEIAPGFDKDNWPDLTQLKYHTEIYAFYDVKP